MPKTPKPPTKFPPRKGAVPMGRAVPNGRTPPGTSNAKRISESSARKTPRAR